MTTDLVQRLHASTTTFHVLAYFSPKVNEKFKPLGLNGFSTYFVARACPMGQVPPEVIAATFYNFHPATVSNLTTDVWSKVTADNAAALRYEAVGEAINEHASASLSEDELDTAIATAQEVVASLSYAGRTLAASTAAQALPDDKLTKLWQLVTIIREWRGDTHIALLVAAGLDGAECLVVDGAREGGTPLSFLKSTRGWPDDEWDAAQTRIETRGLIDTEAKLTAKGIELRTQIEDDTDAADMAMWAVIGTDRTLALHESLKKIITDLVEAKAYGRYDAVIPE